VLEDEVGAGVGEGFGGAGRLAAEVPLDVPEVLEKGRERGGWDEALVEEGVTAGLGGVEDAAGWADCGWEGRGFFVGLRGRGGLSRFCNRVRAGAAMLVGGRHSG